MSNIFYNKLTGPQPTSSQYSLSDRCFGQKAGLSFIYTACVLFASLFVVCGLHSPAHRHFSRTGRKIKLIPVSGGRGDAAALTVLANSGVVCVKK